MVNLRGSVKPKKVNDFKKKSAKVGKRVKRSNTTSISVTSKKINMPLQGGMLSKDSEDDHLKLAKLSSQLHHYNSANRTVAVNELKQILMNSQSSERYIALVLPSALELLFDEDKHTRSSLLDLVSSLVQQCSISSFMSISSIITVYCCSGLTSLNKTIRQDSLILLLIFAHSKVSAVLTMDLFKLIERVLSIVKETSFSGIGAKTGNVSTTSSHQQHGSSSSLSHPNKKINTNLISSSSKTKIDKIAKRVHNKKEIIEKTQKNLSLMQGNYANNKMVTHLLGNISSVESKAMNKNTPTPHFLTIALNTLNELLSLVPTSDVSYMTDVKQFNAIKRLLGNEEAINSSEFCFMHNYTTPQYLILRSSEINLKKINLFSQRAQHATSFSSPSQSHELVTDILARMTVLWSGLTLENSSLINSEVCVVLQLVIRNLHHIIQSVLHSQFFTLSISQFQDFNVAMRSAFKILFRNFPYQSENAQLTMPEGVLEANYHTEVLVMNSDLCELLSMWKMNDVSSSNHGEIRQNEESNQYEKYVTNQCDGKKHDRSSNTHSHGVGVKDKNKDKDKDRERDVSTKNPLFELYEKAKNFLNMRLTMIANQFDILYDDNVSPLSLFNAVFVTTNKHYAEYVVSAENISNVLLCIYNEIIFHNNNKHGNANDKSSNNINSNHGNFMLAKNETDNESTILFLLQQLCRMLVRSIDLYGRGKITRNVIIYNLQCILHIATEDLFWEKYRACQEEQYLSNGMTLTKRQMEMEDILILLGSTLSGVIKSIHDMLLTTNTTAFINDKNNSDVVRNKSAEYYQSTEEWYSTVTGPWGGAMRSCITGLLILVNRWKPIDYHPKYALTSDMCIRQIFKQANFLYIGNAQHSVNDESILSCSSVDNIPTIYSKSSFELKNMYMELWCSCLMNLDVTKEEILCHMDPILVVLCHDHIKQQCASSNHSAALLLIHHIMGIIIRKFEMMSLDKNFLNIIYERMMQLFFSVVDKIWNDINGSINAPPQSSLSSGEGLLGVPSTNYLEFYDNRKWIVNFIVEWISKFVDTSNHIEMIEFVHFILQSAYNYASKLPNRASSNIAFFALCLLDVCNKLLIPFKKINNIHIVDNNDNDEISGVSLQLYSLLSYFAQLSLSFPDSSVQKPVGSTLTDSHFSQLFEMTQQRIQLNTFDCVIELLLHFNVRLIGDGSKVVGESVAKNANTTKLFCTYVSNIEKFVKDFVMDDTNILDGTITLMHTAQSLYEIIAFVASYLRRNDSDDNRQFVFYKNDVLNVMTLVHTKLTTSCNHANEKDKASVSFSLSYIMDLIRHGKEEEI